MEQVRAPLEILPPASLADDEWERAAWRRPGSAPKFSSELRIFQLTPIRAFAYAAGASALFGLLLLFFAGALLVLAPIALTAGLMAYLRRPNGLMARFKM